MLVVIIKKGLRGIMNRSENRKVQSEKLWD
jgi:hypothetical protein